MASKENIPFCPLMSVGTNGVDMVCTQERCAWYMANVKKCAMYIMGYNALIEANNNKKPQQ